MSDYKTPLIYATMAGFVAATTYVTYSKLSSSNEASTAQSREEIMKQFYEELKKELQKYKIELPRDGIYIKKDFFVTLHIIIYKYKKYGQELMSNANFRERIAFLEQKEEMKENQEDLTDEGKKLSAELNEKYSKLVQQENGELDQFTLKLQEFVFDYFNLINKDYHISLEQWNSDTEFVKLIKDEYEKIDKQIKDEEMEEEIPEGLSKEMAT